MAQRQRQLQDRYNEIMDRPREYDDDIPDLMKYENFDVDYLAHYDGRFQKLDAMAPLDRARLGAEEWNRWVQWAQLADERWMAVEERGGHRRIFLPQRPKAGQGGNTTVKHAIVFIQDQDLSEDGYYIIENGEFADFVFPGPVYCDKAYFHGRTDFRRALFVDETWFDDVRFDGQANFNQSRFQENLVFNKVSFMGGASFDAVQFDMVANFRSVVFNDSAWFGDAHFKGIVTFNQAIFGSKAYWSGSRFDNIVDWANTRFIAKADFSNSQFDAAVDFDHAIFGKTDNTRIPDNYGEWPESLKRVYDTAPMADVESMSVPDFRGTTFRVSPNLGFTHVAEPVAQQGLWWQWVKNFKAIFAKSSRTRDADAGAKLRRLQELAADGHHHLAEKRFFRAELLCRRGHEATSWREIAMINLFELFSKCGLSFWRPIFWWANASVFFGFLYWLRSSRFGIGGLWTDLGHLVNYTLANAFPIVGVFHASNSRAVDALFGEAGGVPFDVGLMAGAHNIASTIFLFFALLAVRNYFKLG